FPFAKSKSQSIGKIGDIYHLKELFFNAYPHQNYLFEPQTKHYTCHGDLWDFMYERSEDNGTHLLPLTLEMGSWRWVRKNPLQLGDRLGLFHPMKPHRIQRVLRTHLTLLEFLMNAAYSYQSWYNSDLTPAFASKARALWYSDSSLTE
ncbi:zinc carboxypeptidase, partial [Photobacterium sp. OFAV2-7]|nr:zinc carboxypeptidase [Photobacterium sp. OFAV2-7]